jgi:hypothetical protein
MDEGCSFKTAKLTVYDVHGRIVMEKQLNTDQSEVKILNGSPGVYVLKLDDGERVSTCRHVISE